MARLELKKKSIYKYQGDRDTLYFLILGTSKWGYMYLKIKNNPEYSNIAGLKIDNIGYACINTVMHNPWWKLNTKRTTFYRDLFDKEYSLIVHAIYQYMMNNIQHADDDYLVYADEIIEYNKILVNNTKRSISVIEDTNIDKDDIDNVEEENVPGTNIEESQIDNNSVDAAATKEEPKAIVTENESMSDETNNQSAIDIPVDENDTNNDFEVEHEGIECYDLLSRDCKTTYVANADHAKTKTIKVGKRVYRHIYTKDETLAIAFMNTKAVMAKYNTSPNIASLMIRNAKRKFDFELKSIKRTNNFASLFKAGYSVEEVHKLTNADIIDIRKSYKNYSCNNRDDNDNNAASEKWRAIIKSKDYSTMISYGFMKANDFASIEKCGMHKALEILFDIRNELFKNPLFVIGLEDVALSEESLNSFINKHKTYDGIGVRGRSTSDAIVWVYNKTMELYDSYVSTYDQHSNIIVGQYPIPSSVSEENKDYFLALINNRFNYTKLGNSSNVLTSKQKAVVEKNGSIDEYIKAFMFANRSRARCLKSSYSNRKSKYV